MSDKNTHIIIPSVYISKILEHAFAAGKVGHMVSVFLVLLHTL